MPCIKHIEQQLVVDFKISKMITTNCFMTYKELQLPKDSLFLVTDGAGFIGSNLCKAILNIVYKVSCLDDLSTGK